MNEKKLISTAIAGVMALGLGFAAVPAQADDMGKCWGGAKKGANDCASKDGSHKCSGKATKDNDPNEYKEMTKAECDKIEGATWEAKK